MILEVSLSVIWPPDLWEIYAGHKKLDSSSGALEADSIIIKFLFLMVQFTAYKVTDED